MNTTPETGKPDCCAAHKHGDLASNDATANATGQSRPADASPQPAAAGHHAHHHVMASATPEGAALGKVIDPVCGMSVAADAPLQAMHNGHDYRFCSAGCRTKFLQRGVSA